MTKLPSGTSNIKQSGLKAKDICDIIKECKDVGVAELKFGDLHIKFNSQGPAESVQSQDILTQNVLPGPPELVSHPGTITEELALMDEQEARDVLLSQLMIDDPAAYEKLHMLDGLENDRTANA